MTTARTPPEPTVAGLTPFPFEELEELGERIALLSAQISAATYQLLVLIREFDEREGWGCQECRSCAHWLNWRTGLNLGAAREKVRVARALADLPRISEAMATGELSYSKVRALTRVATPDNEEELLTLAHAGTASHVEQIVRAYRGVCRGLEKEREERRHQSRYLKAYTDEDGMVRISGRLSPEAGAALLKALEAGEEVLYDRDGEREDEATDGASPAQQRADALGLVAEAALSGGIDGASRAERYQVVVHVDTPVLEDPNAPGLSEIEGGGDVSAETSRRIACEASRVVMKHDSEGRILDVGRRTRAISPALRRALTHRDKGCRFPGCGLKFCEAHHVQHWAEGGETKLDNLVLLCRKHHRSLHELGFKGKLCADGGFRVFRPDGREIRPCPKMPSVGNERHRAMLRMLRGAGFSPDAMCYEPGWDGRPFDLTQTLDGLLPRDAGPPG